MNLDWGTVECPLTICSPGEEATVIELAVESEVSGRLRELGLVAGAQVRVVRTGSPLILEVGETRLCLRGPEADGVFVRLAEPTVAADGMSLDQALEEGDFA